MLLLSYALSNINKWGGGKDMLSEEEQQGNDINHSFECKQETLSTQKNKISRNISTIALLRMCDYALLQTFSYKIYLERSCNSKEIFCHILVSNKIIY